MRSGPCPRTQQGNSTSRDKMTDNTESMVRQNEANKWEPANQQKQRWTRAARESVSVRARDYKSPGSSRDCCARCVHFWRSLMKWVCDSRNTESFRRDKTRCSRWLGRSSSLCTPDGPVVDDGVENDDEQEDACDAVVVDKGVREYSKDKVARRCCRCEWNQDTSRRDRRQADWHCLSWATGSRLLLNLPDRAKDLQSRRQII